ncbi:MAG: HD domain-containing protein [Oscillospiraceae bacterium]|nr:HD domain-containing protein [Oscillospiraceae bacterium]
MTEKLRGQLHFLREVDKMKSIFRQTWLTDRSRQENDAEHSWHLALTAMTLFEYCGFDDVDLDRVIRMALVHDLVEIYAGDTFAYDQIGNESKQQREKESADKLFSLLPSTQASEYRALWEEFDQMETHDAIYASAIDRLQSLNNIHLSGGVTWLQHSITSDMIYQRMQPIKQALPELWGYIEYCVNEGLEKGYVKPVLQD